MWHERPGRKFLVILECGHAYESPNPIYSGAPYLCTRCQEAGENPSVMEVTEVYVDATDTERNGPQNNATDQ